MWRTIDFYLERQCSFARDVSEKYGLDRGSSRLYGPRNQTLHEQCQETLQVEQSGKEDEYAHFANIYLVALPGGPSCHYWRNMVRRSLQ